MRAGFSWDIPAAYNIAERCCDSWAARQPDRVAIVDLSGGARAEWTYGQLKRASDGLAASLRARGVRQGDRVAVLLPQSPEVLITHLAAHKLGAIILPLFTLFGADALAYRLADSGAAAVVTDAANLDKLMALRPELPSLSEVYCTDAAAEPVRAFWDEIEAAQGLTPARTGAEDPACLIYTSGTTGDPKGVLHAQRFLIGHLPAIEALYGGFAGPGAVGWTPADWAWIGGLMDLAMPCLYYGVPLVSHRMRKFDPEAAYDLMRREAVSAAFLPPTALKLMRQAPAPKGLALEAVFSGGESLGADLLGWGTEVLGAPINEGYGQTECNLVLATSAGSMPVRPGSMGQAVPGHDVAVIDPAGQELPAGELGEIAVRKGTPVMFQRYWNKPEKTAEKFVGDWMRTGDLGRRDADGYFWYESRDDDVITSAGYRIGPTEIENCLVGHPDIVNAAVVGVPDPARTEAVKAYVVLREGADWEGLPAELVERVRARVSPHMAPRLVERIDALPMTATGKVMRRQLREQS
ncbi:Acetyl-coenzyme A synthetase [Candidatus Rhodobacter oscarellae]|uniref:Acetyl-coenzyme A synthetase n=2 Tax=Candidatus Rhodobacter oscarellae TaxID=1675527 RepID=A0A0J9E135_9RHOB|nr:Acetyl-coenzyme A synthetase [Candidatus Rhodobacter lobularis]